MDKTKVSTGKPKISGAIFRAETTATLPTSATSALSEDFKELGYASEDGIKNNNSGESENIRAWGLDVVETVQTSKDDTFKFSLIESLNSEVLRTVHGDGNVTGTLATGITVTANSEPLSEHAYVIDMILKGNIAKRIVIPCGNVTETGEVTYKDDELISYEVTLTCKADSSGNTHYEYIQEVTA